jgi:hypothetical protein
VTKPAADIGGLKLPMPLHAITISTGPDDCAPIKQIQMERFDGNTRPLFRRGVLSSCGG